MLPRLALSKRHPHHISDVLSFLYRGKNTHLADTISEARRVIEASRSAVATTDAFFADTF